MATAAQHREQARGNRELAGRLLAAYPDDPIALQWVVTTAFYAALHALTSHLVEQGISVRSHIQRDAALADPGNGIPQDAYEAYKRLKTRSESGRYDLCRFAPEDVATTILGRYLATVTTFVGL